MSLLTVHKIFIVAAVLLFLVYGRWEIGNYIAGGDLSALPRAGAAVLCAVGLGIYLRSIWRGVKTPGRH